MSYPFIKSRLVEAKVALTGWFFDFETGTLSEYNPISQRFESFLDKPNAHVVLEANESSDAKN